LLQQNIWLQQQKSLFVVPNFVAVTKPFFRVKKTSTRTGRLLLVGTGLFKWVNQASALWQGKHGQYFQSKM